MTDSAAAGTIVAAMVFVVLALVAVASIWATWFALRLAKRGTASQRYRQAMRSRAGAAPSPGPPPDSAPPQ